MCRIAWAEAYAALSRRAREVPEDAFVIGSIGVLGSWGLSPFFL